MPLSSRSSQRPSYFYQKDQPKIDGSTGQSLPRVIGSLMPWAIIGL